MSLRINTNVDAQAAHRYLTKTSDQVSKSMERLSSGLRINKAADDAAGLGISEKMRSQIRGLAQSQRNIQDGVSMVQTAEGNLDEVHSILQRVRELAVQYKNGSLSTAGKGAIQSEVDALSSEITRIQGAAQFNGINLLGTASGVTFQVGANDGQTIAITFAAVTVGSYAKLDARCAGDHRRRRRRRQRRALRLRCRPEPPRARPRRYGQLPGEPDLRREPYPRRGHG